MGFTLYDQEDVSWNPSQDGFYWIRFSKLVVRVDTVLIHIEITEFVFKHLE